MALQARNKAAFPLALPTWVPGLLVVLAGLFGAAGVGLAAAAAHVTGAANLLAPASAIALAHAPAVLVLALAHERLRTATFAGLLISLGVISFCGALVKLHVTGTTLFPLAAPTGGIAMMLGWLLVALGGLRPIR